MYHQSIDDEDMSRLVEGSHHAANKGLRQIHGWLYEGWGFESVYLDLSANLWETALCEKQLQSLQLMYSSLKEEARDELRG